MIATVEPRAPFKHRGYYGRRKGRKLRAGQSSLLETRLPEFRLPALPSFPIDPRIWFGPETDEMWLEIGFGGGEHLAWQARNHPRIGMIGAEIFINGIVSLLSHIRDGDLRNVRIHSDDVHVLLDVLAEATLDRVFLLFPDPWPKRRHASRRFISAANLDLLARLMRPGAELRFASDDPSMITWALSHLTAHPQFRWLAKGPEDWRGRPKDWPPTRYEAKAIREGRLPVYLRFARQGSAPGHSAT